MPSTYDELLRLELQAVGENPLTWGIKTNTNLQLLAQAVSGHLEIDVGGSGDITLTASNAAADQSRRAFITLVGTLTGNRTIVIPATSKTYIFRRITSGSFTLSIKTPGASPTLIPDGISHIACDGIDCYRVIDPSLATVDQLTTEVSAIGTAIAAVSAATSVNATQIAAVSVLTSANTAAITAVSALTSTNTAAITSINAAVPRLAITNTFNAGQTITDFVRVRRADTSAEGGRVQYYRASDNTVLFQTQAFGTAGAERYRLVEVDAPAELMSIDRQGRMTLLADATAATQVPRKGQLDAVVTAAIGRDQTWSSPTRTHSTSYQNTTGRPIYVAIRGGSLAGSNRPVEVSPDDATWFALAGLPPSGNPFQSISFIVPPNHYYRINGSASIDFWTELS
jgi:hypothetical protein